MTEQGDDLDADPWCWPTNMRRDPKPQALCLCGHGEALHNIETIKQACSVMACGCQIYRHGKNRWRFTGYLDEDVA